jgi:antitoxin VapB
MVGGSFARIRYQLTPNEIRKYRWLGRATTEAVIFVARQLRPGVSEFDMEAMASDALMRRHIRPTVLLMGVDHRVIDYHHHTPTAARLHHYAIVNVCARRWGLVVSVARFAHIGPVPADLRKRFDAAAMISAKFEAHSRPGVTAGQMLNQAKTWYAEAGYPGVWEEHHQGGAIGYMERDWIAVPGSTEVIQNHQAFAWNPILHGALSFDTILVTDNGIENLTYTDDWPSKTITLDGEVYHMPEIFVLPEERHRPQ